MNLHAARELVRSWEPAGRGWAEWAVMVMRKRVDGVPEGFGFDSSGTKPLFWTQSPVAHQQRHWFDLSRPIWSLEAYPWVREQMFLTQRRPLDFSPTGSSAIVFSM